MIARHKAIDILGKYETLVLFDKSVIDLFSVAKKCALLAVEEILEVTKESPLPMEELTGFYYVNYWLDVKAEMEKL